MTENVPYEKWSRQDYRDAYEEAEKLRHANFQELREAREKLKELEQWKNTASIWADHAVVLGRQLAANLGIKPSGVHPTGSR